MYTSCVIACTLTTIWFALINTITCYVLTNVHYDHTNSVRCYLLLRNMTRVDWSLFDALLVLLFFFIFFCEDNPFICLKRFKNRKKLLNTICLFTCFNILTCYYSSLIFQCLEENLGAEKTKLNPAICVLHFKSKHLLLHPLHKHTYYAWMPF